ncbi:hypothetical protein [Rhizobium sp. C1]|uniref:hypothetical protein n=1 Tax=Rhizobium sp. C1 TaxID=1349799 RepID=UPI001E614105|nr:hypothetical protein [Rhizobium sp. C1]MCD2179588.1 hypothetical protein [Rhizobium sp. C1]
MKDFETRAVIDWLTVGVTFKRQTQFRFVQGEIDEFFERTPHVKDYEESSHHTSDRFKITIQEPDIASVVKALAAIDAKFGLRFAPSILGIEFSIDFTPHEPSDLLRAQMHRVLSSHLLTDRDLLTNELARPRTVWGTKLKVLQLVDSTGTAKQSPFLDGTTFFGEKGADVHWRVMDKIIDRQNRAAGTYEALEEQEKRARVEVTLRYDELKRVGLRHFNDLATFNIAELQGRYFRFYLPTFKTDPRQEPHLGTGREAWRDRQRWNAFKTAGNIAVNAMDQATTRHRQHLRKSERTTMQRMKLRLKKTRRIALGKDGTFVAYDDLNRRVLGALRNLRIRVVAGFDP